MVAVGASAQNITAAGATFPYPIYSKWFTEYNQLHPNVKINYQSSAPARAYCRPRRERWISVPATGR